MSRVFIIQDQQQRVDGRLESKFNFEPARHYGELIFLLRPEARPFGPDGRSPSSIVEQLRFQLRDYGENDHLLLVGNPGLIGMAVAIAAQANNGRVRMLQWDGRNQGYVVIFVDLMFGDLHGQSWIAR